MPHIDKVLPGALLALILIPVGCSKVPLAQSQSSPVQVDRDVVHTQHECHADLAQHFIGLQLTPERQREMTTLTQSGWARVVVDGQPITLEYSAERLTIFVDHDHAIQRISCG
jgi:hypothetical protein